MEQKRATRQLEKLASMTKLPSDEMEEQDAQMPLSQTGLNDLREKIKEAMIPLLIQIFHLKQAKQEALSISRLQTNENAGHYEIIKKLLTLQDDLKQLSLWTASCLSQIDKALTEEKVKKTICSASSKSTSHLKFSRLLNTMQTSETSVSAKLFDKFKKSDKQRENLPAKSNLRKLFSFVFRKTSQTP